MFTCIACTKTDERDEDGRESGTPSTKEAVKSLTTQVPILSLSLYILHIGENIQILTLFGCQMMGPFCNFSYFCVFISW